MALTIRTLPWRSCDRKSAAPKKSARKSQTCAAHLRGSQSRRAGGMMRSFTLPRPPGTTMTERLAIVIAVEAYQDQGIPPAAHAEADGAALAAALERLGFAREQQTVLLGAAATHTAVSSRLRKLAKAAPTIESLFFFYAGHAFEEGGHGYLTCADSQLDDLPETSIALQSVLDALKACKCERLALFLDARGGL